MIQMHSSSQECINNGLVVCEKLLIAAVEQLLEQNRHSQAVKRLLTAVEKMVAKSRDTAKE